MAGSQRVLSLKFPLFRRLFPYSGTACPRAMWAHVLLWPLGAQQHCVLVSRQVPSLSWAASHFIHLTTKADQTWGQSCVPQWAQSGCDTTQMGCCHQLWPSSQVLGKAGQENQHRKFLKSQRSLRTPLTCDLKSVLRLPKSSLECHFSPQSWKYLLASLPRINNT